jgi:hypothetical protein
MAAIPKLAHKGLLTGLFKDGESAERAYKACLDLGYEIGEVNVVVAEGTRQRLLKDEEDIKARLAGHKAEGGELGGPSGGRAGILLTIAAAVGAAIAIPAVGFIAGPIAVAWTAAGAAGAAAGLISIFADWGVPAERIHHYEAGIKAGSILMVVETRNAEDVRRLEAAWKKHGGRDIFYR